MVEPTTYNPDEKCGRCDHPRSSHLSTLALSTKCMVGETMNPLEEPCGCLSFLPEGAEHEDCGDRVEKTTVTAELLVESCIDGGPEAVRRALVELLSPEGDCPDWKLRLPDGVKVVELDTRVAKIADLDRRTGLEG